ncbi:hypothetical protein GCM10011374_39840 [Kocuria dechangensis]|uniref:Uncharacterized protein n=1 Tax=Kocuria dechangensis TaxID=1176249 RepID=A0A917H8P6_9MICC|nr:hypothetical protein GCM10011374_39840 [Kocuria dechangensis]
MLLETAEPQGPTVHSHLHEVWPDILAFTALSKVGRAALTAQHDGWAEDRRYTGLEALNRSRPRLADIADIG